MVSTYVVLTLRAASHCSALMAPHSRTPGSTNSRQVAILLQHNRIAVSNRQAPERLLGGELPAPQLVARLAGFTGGDRRVRTAGRRFAADGIKQRRVRLVHRTVVPVP